MEALGIVAVVADACGVDFNRSDAILRHAR
jgi:hypothetical protein